MNIAVDEYGALINQPESTNQFFCYLLFFKETTFPRGKSLWVMQCQTLNTIALGHFVRAHVTTLLSDLYLSQMVDPPKSSGFELRTRWF